MFPTTYYCSALFSERKVLVETTDMLGAIFNAFTVWYLTKTGKYAKWVQNLLQGNPVQLNCLNSCINSKRYTC